jgi:hypothetical protein
VLLGWWNVRFQNVFALCTEANSTSGMFHPAMVRGIEDSIIFQNCRIKARFPGKSAKSIVEETKWEKVIGDENKQNNILKTSMSLFSSLS